MKLGPILVPIIVSAAAGFFVYKTGQALPPVVASHFGANGCADGFMPRDSYLWLMLSITVAVPLLIAFLVASLQFMPPHLLNLPNRDYWLAPGQLDETRAFLYRHGMFFPILETIFLGYVHWLVVVANGLQPPRLPFGPFVTGLVLFFVVLLVWIGVLVVRFRRVPGQIHSDIRRR